MTLPVTGYAEDRTLQSLLNDVRASNLIVQSNHTILAFSGYTLANEARILLVIDNALEITGAGWMLKSAYTGSEMVSDLIVLFSKKNDKLYLGYYAYIETNGILHAGSKQVKDVADPTSAQDASTKAYTDTTVSAQTARIDAILSGSDVDLDQFMEVATAITALKDKGTTDILQITGALTTAVSTLEGSVASEALSRATADSALQSGLESLTAGFSKFVAFTESYTLDLPSTIGDIDFYEPDQLVLLTTPETNQASDPNSTRFLGWTVVGEGIPSDTTIISYRHDYTNYSSVGRAIYANLSASISQPSGSYTIRVLPKLKTDVDANSHKLTNIADAVDPQDVPAFHQIEDAVDALGVLVQGEISDAVAAEATARGAAIATASATAATRTATLEGQVESLFQYFFKQSRSATLA